jgi:glycosyltransferase involved in cell wall biosynthesis
MSHSVEFSVVIPSYNRLKFIKQAISSVEAQTHGSYEIIVVDDGSTDGTMAHLASAKGHRIKLLHQANKGPAAARNLAVKNAVGAYVAFLDSDDVWFPWTLATFHKVIREHDVSLISAATLEIQSEVPHVEPGKLVAQCFTDYFETARDPAYVGSGAMVVKRSVFNQVGGFDETIVVGEDLDFYFRAGTSRYFVRVLSPATLAYRRHEGNISIALGPLYSGALRLLKQEALGVYPGGEARQWERWTLLSRMLRPVALACLRARRTDEAWQLYRQSFKMNARLRRFRFLAGFPAYSLCRW